MLRPTRGDLRAVGHRQQLALRGQPCQPVADGARHRAADAAVDLVKDHRRRAAFLRQRHLQRQDEARQLAAARDLGERGEIGAGVGGDEELDRVHPLRSPALDRQAQHGGAEARGVELERGELGRHRPVEPQRRLDAVDRQRLGARLIVEPGEMRRLLERADLRFAALDRIQLRAHRQHAVGQVIDLAGVLARGGAQIEQAGLDTIEHLRIVAERFGGAGQAVLRLPRLDHRPVERPQRLGEQRMLAGDAVEPAGGAAQRGQRRIRSGPEVLQFGEIARQPLALLHRRARLGELRLLAGDGRERGQFLEVREQQVLVGRGLRDARARRLERLLGRAPLPPGALDADGVRPAVRNAGITIEQRAVAARIDQAAIVVLAVQLHQERRQLAQQRDADGLVVDECLAAAIDFQLTLEDQRLARLDRDVGVVEQRGDAGRQRGELEARHHARPVLAGAHQPAVGPRAEHQAQRVEQDRLARAGLAGQHAQPAGEVEVQRLDQDDVADGEPGQHVRRAF